MLNFLKNSKGEILNLFFKDSDRKYYLREIAKELNKEPGQIQQILNSFVEQKILHDERKANLRFFWLNKEYSLYEEIKKIISKTLGIEIGLKKIIDEFNDIEYAFIFGSIAQNKENSESDIDLMLIGSVNQDQLIEKINKLEDELNREINYHIYDKMEILKKIKENNDFIKRVFDEPKIILRGNPDEFTSIN